MTEPRQDPHAQAHAHPADHPRSEEDRISSPRILAVGATALVIFFLASVATSYYFAVKQGERGPLPLPPEIGQSKIGLVEQEMFERARRGDRDRAARLEHLRSFGWVDRDAGVVYIPIERAMELVVKGVRPAPSPPAAAAAAPVPRIQGGQP